MEFWDPEILEGIINSIGTFVKVADMTRKVQYTSYAQIYVYMNIAKPLPDYIELEYHDEVWLQLIDYENILFRCRRCHEYNHIFWSFPLKKPGYHSLKEKEADHKVQVEGVGYKEVQRKKWTPQQTRNHKAHQTENEQRLQNIFSVLQEEGLEAEKEESLQEKGDQEGKGAGGGE